MTAPVVLRSITKVDEMVSVSDAAEAAGELLRMRQSPAGAATYPGQDGDSSPPSLKRQPQSGPQDTNVGTVVSKAKRAASSLWLLLHAQNCNATGDRCPHTGCSDAKLILLHIKTCPAENCSDCPLQYKGCQQSRKLLAHYRKCRDIRARQAGVSRLRSQPHVCLVCSLVARQARNVLDGTRQTDGTRKVASSTKKTMSSSYSMKQAPQDSTVVVPRLDPAEPPKSMPPPPPKAPSASAPILISKQQHDPNVDDAEMNQCESPPSASQLIRPGLAALAAAAAPEGQSADPSLLGKSLDSSSKIDFLIHATETRASPIVAKKIRRPRAESCHVMSPSKGKPIQLDIISTTRSADEYDPTVENELKQEQGWASIDEPKTYLARRRSASMSLLSFSNGNCCETINEEVIATSEDQVFLMEEDTEL